MSKFRMIRLVISVVVIAIALIGYVVGHGIHALMGLFGHAAPNSTSSTISIPQHEEGGNALNDYIEAYNKSLDTFGFIEEYKNYRKNDIAHANAHSSFNVNDGWMPQALEKLKSGRAKSKGPASLDAAADDLIAKLDKVITHVQSLKTYYDSKAYLEDNLARGKKEDAQMLKEFSDAHDALERFNGELDKQIEVRDQATLQSLKSKGEMVEYDTKVVLKQADVLLRTLRDADNPKDPALFTKTDAQVVQIEATLADLRQQVQKYKSEGKEVPSAGNQVDTYLTSMLGSYRDLKAKHDPSYLHNMFQEYNSAVNDANE